MIAVLDTRIANAASVLYALERMSCPATLTQDPAELGKSSHVILPGVGSATALMDRIHSLELKDCLLQLKQPVLGVCLGMQAFYGFSEEGGVSCLGILPGTVTRISPKQDLPIPHMGWNQVFSCRDSQLLKGIPEGSYFYFVHSFRAPKGPETSALTQYGEDIPAAIESSNWFGTQFHPERSGALGEQVLRNFLNV